MSIDVWIWPSRQPVIALLVTCCIFNFVISVSAQGDSIEKMGRQEFTRSCAVCHGENAKGDGPLSELLVVAPPDLTSIRRRHGGQFPASWVYRIIDGRSDIRSHGSEEMPIWGDRYRADALLELPLPMNVGADAVVHGRILTLVYYLDLIQED